MVKMNVFEIFITCLHGLGMGKKTPPAQCCWSTCGGGGWQGHGGAVGAPVQLLGQLQPWEVCTAPSSSWHSSTPYPIKEKKKRERKKGKNESSLLLRLDVSMYFNNIYISCFITKLF